ncbi:MAG: FHA domain-containing protein, partial [Merismopedia sp. SIO2A8]|nr:FHA domain-containing protein [Merismopedia sp. SIO2A8]
MVPRPLTAVLRQISPGGIASIEFYPLPLDDTITLGRDPVCHIVLDSRVHKGVSRQHAKLEPIPGDPVEWYVNDLESSNGTYVNGCRIKGGERLYEGDRISLGKRGPQFIFEYLEMNGLSDNSRASSALISDTGSVILSESSPMSYSPPNEVSSSATYNDVTFSQLFPIISTGKDLTRKAYLVPGVITVLLVVFLFLSVGEPMLFNTVLAGYLAAAAYYFVYQLCGKYKPWWLLFSAGAMTAGVLMSPILTGFIWVFRGLLPGDIPD